MITKSLLLALLRNWTTNYTEPSTPKHLFEIPLASPIMKICGIRVLILIVKLITWVWDKRRLQSARGRLRLRTSWKPFFTGLRIQGMGTESVTANSRLCDVAKEKYLIEENGKEDKTLVQYKRGTEWKKDQNKPRSAKTSNSFVISCSWLYAFFGTN